MYGTVRTVVWEDGGREAASYPIAYRKVSDVGLGASETPANAGAQEIRRTRSCAGASLLAIIAAYGVYRRQAGSYRSVRRLQSVGWRCRCDPRVLLTHAPTQSVGAIFVPGWSGAELGCFTVAVGADLSAILGRTR